jgi:hypothetical protein
MNGHTWCDGSRIFPPFKKLFPQFAQLGMIIFSNFEMDCQFKESFSDAQIMDL